MPEALYFTGNAEADELIAAEPLALLVGFVLDQQGPSRPPSPGRSS